MELVKDEDMGEIRIREIRIQELTDDNIKEFTDDEIKELIYGKYNPLIAELQKRTLVHPLRHPLIAIREGYRLYENTKDWNCHFCGDEIKVKNGYWGVVDMQWSQGTKLCHRCFLKFLIMMEENWSLRMLFERIYERDLEVFDNLKSPLDF